MTANRTPRRSLSDELDADMPLEAAAADAAVKSVALINNVVDRAGLLQSQLASILGLTEGRVSQVLNGDGNIRVSTLARFLRAAGFDLDVAATPVAGPVAEPEEDSSNEGPTYMAHKIVTCFREDRLYTSDVLEYSDTHPSTRLEEKYVYIQNLRTGESELHPEPVPLEPSFRANRLVESRSSHVRA